MSRIEWTEQTWNPVVGCTKVSPGCKYCYAEIMARRLQGMNSPGYENGFALSLMPERLQQPLLRKKPTLWFVNSMSDLFHSDVPGDFIDQIIDVMWQTPHHTYQVLTKRAERLPAYFADHLCPPNLWLGVSVEDQRYGLPRIDLLRTVPAPIRFISAEPLLEDLGQIDLTGIHWVIVGGETGPKARPTRKAWVENIQQQTAEAKAAFFFKQWGRWGDDGQQPPEWLHLPRVPNTRRTIMSEEKTEIGGIAAEALRQFIDRIERLEEEKRGLSEDIKEVYGQAKSQGFDTKAIRKIVALRRLDRQEREEQEELIELYLVAIGEK